MLGKIAFYWNLEDQPTPRWNVQNNQFVDLTDHQALSVVDRSAFDHFFGRVLLTGSLPNLTYIGSYAFTATVTDVHLVNLPELQFVADNAFKFSHGTVTMTGRFPRLEVIGAEAI